jgi:hypothetical protein
MLHFKSCPKCTTGTIEKNFDAHGSYLQCLNCGFMRDVDEAAPDKAVKSMLARWRKELHAAAAEGEEAVA